MIFIYILLLFLLCWHSKVFCISINTAYLTKDSTNIIKGLFIALVFMSHIQGYIQRSGYEYTSFGDHAVLGIQSTMGQLVVVMFLFYSGYGIMEQYKFRGQAYVSTMPKRRILTTLLNFDVAVCLFIIADLLLNVPITASQCLYSLFAWQSVGNSNWYIFVILLCYGIAYIGFKLVQQFSKQSSPAWLIGTILVLTFFAYIFLLVTKTQEWWFYNTIFSFWAGMTYSMYKEEFESFGKDNYLALLSVMVAAFVLIWLFPKTMHGMKDNMLGVVFAFLIVVITMRVEFNSKPLRWLGERLFPLYIYQRIPMMVLYEFDQGAFVYNHLPIYIMASIIVTLMIGHFYKHWQISLR